jgi:hypothetical protein
MKKSLLTLIVLCCAMTVFAQKKINYETYKKKGLCVKYPTTFTLDDYGFSSAQSFTYNKTNRSGMMVSREYKMDSETFESAFKKQVDNGGEVSAKTINKKEKYFIIEGAHKVAGTRLYYAKTFLKGGYFYSLVVTYLPQEAAFFKKIIPKIADSFMSCK